MPRYLSHILLLLCCCSLLRVMAVETVLVGDVLAEATGEPIAGASVYFQGTQIGTATNDEGAFALRCDLTRRHTLVVSAVGYRTGRLSIEPGTMAGVQVTLVERTAVLEEVLAVPGVNLALPLLEQVRAHSDENERVSQQYEHSMQSDRMLFISDIRSKHLQRNLWSSLQAGMLVFDDSTWLLPLYRSQATWLRRGQHMQQITDEDARALVLTPTDYSALLTDDDIHFYNTHINLMGHSFLSPLASSGNLYYRYYLVDSVEQIDRKDYVVDFRTKNPFYATLNGRLWIDSATYALHAVEAQVPRETNVNYLRGASIRQSFGSDRTLRYEQVDKVMDFAVKTDNNHTFPTVLIRNNLSCNDADSADKVEPMPIEDKSEMSHWSNLQMAAAMDSLESLPVVRVAKWLAYIVNTGYIPTKTWVDIGHVQELLQINHTEGVHVGIPVRTNERLWHNVSLEAAVGYGFRTQRFTGLGRVSAILPAQRRHMLVAEYQDHYVWPEVSVSSQLLYENNMGYHTMDFTAYALEALYANAYAQNTMVRQRQFQLRTENEWTDNIESDLYLRVGGYTGLRYQTLGGVLRVGWHERKVDLFMRRVHVHSVYPVLYFGAEVGSWTPWQGMQNGYQLYSRLSMTVRQHVVLPMAGTLDYAVTAGTLFGQVPDVLLHHHAGNQGYAYDPYRFTLMNNGQYIGRHYLETHLAWDGQGVLFNLIPGVRYLRLHELVTTKMAYGDALSIPYVEVGCGIGNILRVLDLHSVWRLTHRDDPTTPLWAMRFRIHLGL